MQVNYICCKYNAEKTIVYKNVKYLKKCIFPDNTLNICYKFNKKADLFYTLAIFSQKFTKNYCGIL